jgi:hypothetical protein
MNTQMMESKMIDNAVKHLFDEQIQLTNIVDYGVSWEGLTTGQAVLPPIGLRFDLDFEGRLTGEVNGVIKGTDYLEIRADGKFQLHIQARIITDDGETIAVKEDGISTPGDDGTAVLNLNMQFYTVSEKYSWINKKQAWAVGEVDMLTGAVKMKCFSN